MGATEQVGQSKAELLAIAKGLRVEDSDAVESAVAFLAAESRGHWHNRARAKFARRLKHCQLQPSQAAAVSAAVICRLVSGQFPEQFTDQLRLALKLDGTSVLEAAREGCSSPHAHVKRYAAWVLEHHGAQMPPNNSSKPTPLRGAA